MHIPTEQFERVPIYMLSPTPSPPNEKSSAELQFGWSNKPDSTFPQKDTSESENEDESKSLPSKINDSQSRMSHIVRMLTAHHGNKQNVANARTDSKSSSSTNGTTAGHLVKVCRDCKILVRHLIDIGHANFVHSTQEG